jgi:hypothetical protein
MRSKIQYTFTAELWQRAAAGGWHFFSLPQAMAAEIREQLQWQEEGWGRLKASARLGTSQWETAIWFDTRRQTYLLPVRAAVRRREKIGAGDAASVSIRV